MTSNYEIPPTRGVQHDSLAVFLIYITQRRGVVAQSDQTQPRAMSRNS